MKKALIVALCIICVVACVIGGTVASTPASSSGGTQIAEGSNVDIVQNIKQSTDTGETAIDNNTLSFMPAYVSGGVQSAEGTIVINAADVRGEVERRVSVTNVGDESVFIRTIFAIPYSEILKSSAFELITETSDASQANWKVENCGVMDLEGKKYQLISYTYDHALATKHDTSTPSVTHIYLKPEVTGRVIDELGSRMDLPVITQAVQATSANTLSDVQNALDAKFGAITATSNPWLNASGQGS